MILEILLRFEIGLKLAGSSELRLDFLTHIRELLQCLSFLCVSYNLLITQRRVVHVHSYFQAGFMKLCTMHSVCFSYNGLI